MARCTTCHRRLASGKACPAHGGEPAPIAETKTELGERPAWIAPSAACIGRGGFASVWSLEPVDGVERVLKVAHADHGLSRARIAREAEALVAIHAIHEARPNRPRAVPTLFDRGVTDGRAWIVMERVRGENLADATLEGPVRADRAVKITLAILDALEHVHLAGFVHRDLKPDNLIRTPSAQIVVLDLGIARKWPTDPDDPTRAGVQIGSLEYMPPEQAVDPASVDARSDLYAVGCILFELCTGRPPFVGDVSALERAHAALRPPRLSELAPVPQVLEVIVQDVLAKDPAKRSSSAAELRARLLATRDTPSIARSVPTLSQVTESKQPVVLVWAELPKVDRALLGQFSARHVIVVSQRGRKVMGALLGSTHADPASAALALAQDLAGTGARVACHLDALVVDASGPVPAPKGEAIDRVESWLPTDTWTGVIVTRALAAVAQVATRSSSLGDAFRQLASPDTIDSVELVGRGALLVDLAADAAAALRGAPSALEKSASGSWAPTGPAFALLYGDAGTGKTVFAAELGRRIADLGPKVHVAAVPAPGMAKRGALDELIGATRGVRPIGDALRAHARDTGRGLAILLDDLHFADAELLDALEYATLGGESLPLWILGLADPRLESRRPQLGARAERRRRDVLSPLDEEAAVELTTRLLKPAEYPPLRAVRQLVALARGNPLHLTMLAREIHERGAIRPRPGSSEFFLDTTALDSLEPIALGPWIAARAIAGLAPELVALARACAVIGGPFAASELVSVLEAVERAGGPTTTIDPDVGVKELIAAQILVVAPTGGVANLVFRQALVEEGLYATTDEVAKRAFHEAALAHEQAEGGDPARIARHAEAVGESVAAGAAFALLGVRAEHEHRPLEAEQAWAGAVRHLVRRDEPRARALLGLARARMRLQRLTEALDSTDEAISIARGLEDYRLEVEALLEKAIIHDFTQEFERSREAALAARSRLVAESDLSLDVDLAEARSIYRDQRFDQAAPLLRDVLSRARARERTEIATIAALLLGCALSDLGALDESEQVFDELISTCEASGDTFHLAAAYGNRAWLWSARGAIDRTAADLRSATQFARESGQALVERAVTHNLSEQMLWTGALDEALLLARRGLALQERSGEGSTSLDRLLLARILASRKELTELREVLATFVGNEQIGEDNVAAIRTLEVLRLFVTPSDPETWQAVLASTLELYIQLRLELQHLAAVAGVLPEEMRIAAHEAALRDPIWRLRVSVFRRG
ncbi:MAG: protein kinase domain-containing protein [Kofleriaceae bacterium]